MNHNETELESALYAPRSRTRWITIRPHDEFGVEVPIRQSPPKPDGRAMQQALETMAEAGRNNPSWFGDRRSPWLRGLEDHLPSRKDSQ